jgi:hypothetical protein
MVAVMGRGKRATTAAMSGNETILAALRGRAQAPTISAAKVWEASQADVVEHSQQWADMLWEQQRLGGKPYRINQDRLDVLRKRIDLLNRKAGRLGADPITLTVTNEHTTELLDTDDGQRIADWTFVVMGNSGPVIPGFAFLAALDHTKADNQGQPAVAIRRLPEFAALQALDEDDIAKLRGVDLEDFRHAENRCEHCGLRRKRNTTYLMFDKETGTVVQVGSDCLKDFTGAENPEKAARWAEMLAALDADMQAEGMLGHDVAGRPAIPTIDYLANAAAVARAHGWQRRWDDGFRVTGTADHAHDNMTNGGTYATVTKADRQLAADALAWARDDLADRDDLSEFDQNLVTYANGDYLGQKGDGLLAYLPQAYLRELKRRVKAGDAALSEWVGQPKQRIKDLRLKVNSVYSGTNAYGVYYRTRMVDADGNHFLWKGSQELEPGETYTMAGTVKGHELDQYAHNAKTTVITNCRAVTAVDDGA